MTLNSMLAAAQAGQFHAHVADALGLPASSIRATMDKLCPAIAAQLKTAAAKDEDLFEDLLDLLEDGNEGSPLDDKDALTGSEAIDDGSEILSDIYGGKEKALAALKSLAGDIPAASLPKLAAISATAVLASLAQANQPMALSGAQQAVGGEGILGAIVGAIVSGVVSEAKRQVSQRTGVRWGTRRRRRTATRRKTTRKTTTSRRKRSRSTGISLEDIFRNILK